MTTEAALKKEAMNTNDNVKKSSNCLLDFKTLFSGSKPGIISWLNPQFENEKFEAKYKEWSFVLQRRLFRLSLVYLTITQFIWLLYFCVMRFANWYLYLIINFLLVLGTLAVFAFTYTKKYKDISKFLSLGIMSAYALTICLVNFVYKEDGDGNISHIGLFACSLELIFIFYTCTSLPLYVCLAGGIIFSTMFELLSSSLTPLRSNNVILARALLHIAINMLAVHICLQANVRKRSTFRLVANQTYDRAVIEKERARKKNMIESLMPATVAEKVIKESPTVTEGSTGNQVNFRNFYMDKMENVSILFADIVGFTKMSSNKTANKLVFLLDDLFGRFDKLCVLNGCEKISTLGDCYYCVGGCPIPRPDHAQCCVEMGLSMVEAIKEFDQEHNEEVNMRVGVHTGTVLCGLVGTLRFKYDVWSNDVTLANTMESSGEPGRVHISIDTYNFCSHLYHVEKGQPVEDIRIHRVLIEDYDPEKGHFRIRHVKEEDHVETYFILSRKYDEKPKELYNSETNNASDVEQKEERPLMEEELNADFEPNMLIQHNNARQSANDEQLIISLKTFEVDDCFSFKNEVNTFTLIFKDKEREKDFHSRALSNQFNTNTYASSRGGYAMDVLIALLFTMLIAISLVLVLEWTVCFLVLITVLGLILIQLLILTFKLRSSINGRLLSNFLYGPATSNLIGAFVISIPCFIVYSFTSCSNITNNEKDIFFLIALSASLFHFVNFSNATFILKNVLVFLAASFQIIFIFVDQCKEFRESIGGQQNFTNNENISNENYSNYLSFWMTGEQKHEVIVNIILLILLTFALNRAFAHENRILFHRHTNTKKVKDDVEKEQKQVQLFLDNVIPKYISHDLENATKTNNVYSKNHKNIGVIFAKITNFHELYDEGFADGMEYLRVLNELMGDLEALLSREEYIQVEKIKTIGACLMAVSGLDEKQREKYTNPKRHLYSLMDFSLSLLDEMKIFNEGMLNFDFEMSIGYNVGEVTAGVIGKQKLQYDIWGDTVNVSSRMYSTGVPGHIQVTEQCMEMMNDMYEFKFRGMTYVKGKGDLKTYLLVKKKDEFPLGKYD